MNGDESNSLSVMKDIFYRFCFCIGLGTAAVASYGQVKAWISPDAPSLSRTESNHVLQQQGFSQPMEFSNLPAPMPAQMVSAPALGALPVSAQSNEPASEGSSVPAAPSVAAESSPSPSPAESPAAVAENSSPEAAPAPAMEPVSYPVSPEMLGMTRAPARQEESIAPKATGASATDNSVGGFMGGVPQSAQNSNNNSSVASGSGSSGNSNPYNPPAPVNSASVFNAQDVALVTSAMKGLFSDQMVTVSGLYCGGGTQAGAGCSRENHFAIHSSRFTSNEGLATDASFSISGQNAGDLSLHVGLKIQNANGSYQTFSMNEHVEEVRVSSDQRDGRSLRVIDLKISSVAFRAKERLNQVRVHLVFETSGAGEVQLLAESSVRFSRKIVQVVPAAWNFDAPMAVAPNEPILIADEITYSMAVEKSL